MFVAQAAKLSSAIPARHNILRCCKGVLKPSWAVQALGTSNVCNMYYAARIATSGLLLHTHSIRIAVS